MDLKESKRTLSPSNTLIVITGPTASGKTKVSLELSKLLNIEIISADSRQVYKLLDIGTAKPSKEELSLVKHHFIDILFPDEYYSAGLFSNQAKKTALEIIKRGNIPVIVGGSGLYIQALCEGLFLEPTKNINNDKEVSLHFIFENKTKEELYKELLKVDPLSAKKYSDMNPRRLQRALEFYYKYGYPLSKAQKNKDNSIIFNTIYYGIDIERATLYDIIDKRCENMWKEGLVEETEQILKMGYSPNLNSLNTVGYKEVIEFLKGKLNRDEAIYLMKKNTRHYAKRQMTWFRKNKNIHWINGNYIEIAKIIANSKLFE